MELESGAPLNGGENTSGGHPPMDRDILTRVQWDLMAITQHLQVVQDTVAAAIGEPGTSEESSHG